MNMVAQEQSKQVVELELSVARLHQREKRLRAVLSSAFTSRQNRLDAREELEVVLNKTEASEDELLLLDSADGVRARDREEPAARASACCQSRGILGRRFGGRKR